MSRPDRPRLPGSLEPLDDVVLEALDNAQIGLVILLDDGSRPVPVYVSDRFAEIAGRGRDELMQSSALSSVAPEELGRMRALRERYAAGEPTPPSWETILMKKGGERVPVEVGTSALRTSAGVATVSFVRDISDRRNLQQRLALADRMATVGTVAAGVAHEVNNPLTYVLLNLDRAERALTAAADAPAKLDSARSALADAREGVLRVRDIVADLRTFSLVDQEDRSVDIVRVLRSVLRIARKEIRERAALTEQLQAVPDVRGNEGRLGQVFLNLLMNAAQAIPQGAAQRHHIRVASRTEGARVVIEIEDTGVGMPEEVLRRIFDPFFTTKPISVGTGLGLSICHRIITHMGGEIQAESKVGEGSLFRVYLPLPVAH